MLISSDESDDPSGSVAVGVGVESSFDPNVECWQKGKLCVFSSSVLVSIPNARSPMPFCQYCIDGTVPNSPIGQQHHLSSQVKSNHAPKKRPFTGCIGEGGGMASEERDHSHLPLHFTNSILCTWTSIRSYQPKCVARHRKAH